MSILSEDLENKTFSITERDLIEDHWRPYKIRCINNTYNAFIKSIFLNDIILGDIIRGHVEIYKVENGDKWILNCYDYAHSTQDVYASCIVNNMENLIGCVNQFKKFIKI